MKFIGKLYQYRGSCVAASDRLVLAKTEYTSISNRIVVRSGPTTISGYALSRSCICFTSWRDKARSI